MNDADISARVYPEHRSHRGPASIQSMEQSSAQFTAGFQQHGQESGLQLLTRDAPGMGADVQRGQHLAGGILEWNGQRTQAHFQFLIDDDPTLLANLGDVSRSASGLCKVRLVFTCRSARPR